MGQCLREKLKHLIKTSGTGSVSMDMFNIMPLRNSSIILGTWVGVGDSRNLFDVLLVRDIVILF